MAKTSTNKQALHGGALEGQLQIMRRALLILLMWLVPFQAVCLAGHALHGHNGIATEHNHTHDHDGGHDDSDIGLMTDSELPAHGDDGQHGSHGHAGFTFMVIGASLGLYGAHPAQAPPGPHALLASHIPLLPDPPPIIRI